MPKASSVVATDYYHAKSSTMHLLGCRAKMVLYSFYSVFQSRLDFGFNLVKLNAEYR